MAGESARENAGSDDLLVYTVDAVDDGIVFGQQKVTPQADIRDALYLRLPDMEDFPRLRSRYALHRDRVTNPLWELERHLMRLSQQGVLAKSTVLFGVSTDPFFPFEGKFDVSMKFLQLFERYIPGQLVVQTRSPLVVIAMPVFRRLGKHASVTIALETNDEESVRRLTPGLPRVEDRLRAARALKNLGVEVTMQVAPLLPYGDWRSDAGRFAEELIAHADFVHVRNLQDGIEGNERRARRLPLSVRLAHEKKFAWLRPDAAKHLLAALELSAPEKLRLPLRGHHMRRQIGMFAA